MNDPIALERANYQHYLLERLIKDLCSERDAVCQFNRHIDLLARFGSTTVVFEMKSCRDFSIRAQVRRAVSQLLEYRYLYRSKLGGDVRLCAVIERRPRKTAEWLEGYLDSLKIGLIWKNDEDQRLNCTVFTRRLLENLMPRTAEPNFSPSKPQ